MGMKHYRKLWVVMMAILVVTAIGGTWVPIADAAAAKPVATYLSPERIQFISYSKSWNQTKLKSLYADLMRNLHGEELAYLGKVVLSPKKKEGEAGVANMAYSWSEDDMSDIVMDKGTEIVLYDADSLKTVESLSATLSHEYGHHFTHYWLIKKERKLPSSSNTKWASLRGIKNYPVVFSEDGSEPGYTHMWDATEIMADDYMALFGSPTAKQAMADSLRQDDGLGFYGEIENTIVPPVMSLQEVRSYWLKLSGLKDLQPLVFKEPKITGVQALADGSGGYNYKLTFAAASAIPDVARRLQYIVYWTDEEDDSWIDFSPLKTGTTSLVISGDFLASKLTLTVYAFDPKTKGFVYARPVKYNFSNEVKPVKAA
ncbi:hypothetical protein [Cohnella abietis]|uniref:Uncharacterized protein n=1 Tax=Cohnella abietis TaxID=2507935 RepID=A0A3T1CYI2_9BACL|nr:hypothetical protein [Cohnella abietis]BBI30913.1 hypothetical protein KCTCHS21_03120 [Cohnella abietis]